MYWIQARVRRLVVIFGAVLVFLVLLITNLLVSSHEATSHSLVWVSSTFSTFTALMFLCIGSLVWLYARERSVAVVLLGLSLFMMIALVNEIGSSFNSTLGFIGAGSSVYVPPFLSLLLLIFPQDYLFLRRTILQKDGRSTPQTLHLPLAVVLLRSYPVVLFIVAFVISGFLFYSYTHHFVYLDALNILEILYFTFGLIGILITTATIYFRSSSIRERQQVRIFVGGIILTVAPFLLLTVVPMLSSSLAVYAVDARLSTLTFVIFPLAFGYSILRYQILIFDSYIQRAVSWLVGVICLIALIDLVVALVSFFSLEKASVYVILIAIVSAFLAPYAWNIAKTITLRLFFNELAHYRHLLEKPARLYEESLDLEAVAKLLTLAAVQTWETQEVCLFVLHEQTGQYILSPPVDRENTEPARQSLLTRMMQYVLKLDATVQKMQDAIDERHPIIARLQSSTCPLLLSEIMRSQDTLPTGLSRYLNIETSDGTPTMLLAPVRAQGRMIGVLALGERGDHQLYAGPDFEVVQLLLDRYSSVLETARLYQRVKQSTDLLNSLYQASMLPWSAFQTIEELGVAYTQVAAKAVCGSAEIWLYDQEKNVLQRISGSGEPGLFIANELLSPSQQEDWLDCFFEGEKEQRERNFVLPPCLSTMPLHPFAWLPLNRAEKHLGVLVLSYPLPHIFTLEERHVLHMFARQYTVALENITMALALRDAYERQKELDILKDQFVMTASHELRTPLTAVQGYIDLLKYYNSTLTNEIRADFIAKAHRGCDELALMVSNITDASRIHIDAENMNLQIVSLYNSIVHIVEIIEMPLESERHDVHIDVSADLLVVADDLRLRQILLNLVNNAQKYSPADTAIEISACGSAHLVTVSVRDHGAGILPKDQERIFERFVRLERDINSPVRGAGLGLYICKKLVKAMGGDIWVESSGESGQGSVFSFTLPTTEHLPKLTIDTDELQTA